MIGIVHHSYLVGDWKEIVSQQLKRLNSSGLYEAADAIHFTVNLANETEEEFNKLIVDHPKIQTQFYTENSYEYPGIKKVKELGDNYDDIKILYFHAKGVSNDYKNYATKEKSNEKIKNIKLWKECLEYFVIDKWKECIDKLDVYDTAGVTCNNGWYWGNFWWATSKHIKGCDEVGMWGRWDYEDWLNRGRVDSKNYEWYKFTYHPYITSIDPDWYRERIYLGKKITLHKAFYGSPEYEIDEGYGGSILNTGKDVTDIVKVFLEQKDNLCFDFEVNNETMGGDPIYLTRKFLIVEFSPKEINKIYKIGVSEGTRINFCF